MLSFDQLQIHGILSRKRDPVRMITSGTLITLPKPTFKKNLKREDRLFKSKILYFQPIWAKCRLDNTIFIWYSHFDCLKPVGTCCLISGSTICYYSSPAVTQHSPGTKSNSWSSHGKCQFFSINRVFLKGVSECDYVPKEQTDWSLSPWPSAFSPGRRGQIK